MRWGWLINSFADPHLKLTAAQRREALRIASERHLRGRLGAYTLGMVVLPLAVAFALIGAVDNALAARLGISLTAAHVVLIALVCLAAWPLSAWAYGRLYARPYRRALRDAGMEICEGCGYPLDGLDGRGCPECGGDDGGSGPG